MSIKSLKKSPTHNLICNLCKSSIHVGTHCEENIGLCQDCYQRFDEFDRCLMLDIFNSYGGFFNKHPLQDHSKVSEIIRETYIKIQLDFERGDIFSPLKRIHDLLIKGVSLEEISINLEITS